MKNQTLVWAAAALSCLTINVHAMSPSHQEVKDKLEAITGFTVKSVQPHETGLIEIVADTGIFYSTPDGEHLFNGQVHEFSDGLLNITARKKSEVATNDIRLLKEAFISYKAPDEKYEVVVFFDTTCGYCRTMHNQMSQYNARGITIHYAIWPRQGLFVPDSKNQLRTQDYVNMQSIACAPNPQIAMDMVMRNTKIPKAECDSKIDDTFMLGQWLGVRGTPAIYDTSGKQLTRGYLPPAQLLATLEGKS